MNKTKSQQRRLRIVLCALGCGSMAILAGCTAAQTTDPAMSTEEVVAYITTEPTIVEIQAALEKGEVTSEQLVGAYLDRIDAYDDEGPALNAMVYVNSDAVDTAASLDEERRESGSRGPLFGIPVILKDNIDTADMPTSVGSVALGGSTPDEDAFIVTQLRDAGAIILGKANLQEFAYGFATTSSFGGQTLNPYDLSKNPSGSSGGSAVAVAANFAPLAFGTDTGGSIRVPASATSSVGIRPTKGLIGRSGIAPVSTSLDTVGPMATSVSDIASALDLIAGVDDPDDPVALGSDATRPDSYLDALDPDALDGARIVVLDDAFGESPEAEEVNEVMARMEADLVAAGAVVSHISELGFTSESAMQNDWEMEAAFDAYLQDYGPDQEGVTFAEMTRNGGIVTDVSASLQALVGGPDTTDPSYEREVVQPTTAFIDAFSAFMEDNDIDALLYPSAKEAPSALGVSNWGAVNAFLASSAGAPAISFPAGFTSEGLPVGAELVGKQFDEATIIGLAYAYEAAHPQRVRPSTTP
ncbi:amidase [Microbacterium sp. Gd 4-13]|nr:amidase [Microbacterium sp. Gd 4-13]